MRGMELRARRLMVSAQRRRIQRADAEAEERELGSSSTPTSTPMECRFVCQCPACQAVVMRLRSMLT